MATATGAMKQMQCSVNPAAVAATAQAFAKESAKMDMAQEMMGDAVDGLDDEAAEDESSELVSQVRPRRRREVPVGARLRAGRPRAA